MITLTVAEIYDLACMSGFTINHRPDFMPDADDMEAEIVIIECPKQGVRDDEGKAHGRVVPSRFPRMVERVVAARPKSGKNI